MRIFIEQIEQYGLGLIGGYMIYSFVYSFTGDSIWLWPAIVVYICFSSFCYSILKWFFGKDKVERLESSLGRLLRFSLGAVALVFAARVFIYQVYQYLRNGIWQPISVIDYFALTGFDWAVKPTDWIGLWELTNKIPLSLVLFIISGYIFMPMRRLLKKLKKYKKQPG